MKRTYTGTTSKVVSIAMNEDDQRLLAEVYAGLRRYYDFDDTKPTLSALLLVTIKRYAEKIQSSCRSSLRN